VSQIFIPHVYFQLLLRVTHTGVDKGGPGIDIARIFDWGCCKFSALTPFTLDDINHS